MKTTTSGKTSPCCQSAESSRREDRPSITRRNLFRRGCLWIGGACLGIWWLVYRALEPAAAWFTHALCGLPENSRAGAAVSFFVFETPKVLMLLALIVFAVGVVRSFFPPEKTRGFLTRTCGPAGHVSAALLGIVTPFCSCSAVPLFIGFVTAGIPLGVTFSFLIAAPMVNEVALVLLFGLFGWKVAAIYLGTGLAVAIACGWIIGRLRMEKHVEEWVYQVPAGHASPLDEPDAAARIRIGLEAVKDIVGKIWPYVVAGIAMGAGIHGYVPENFMASIMGKNAWWSVPLAVLVGVPMYSNAAGVIPIVQALLGKGAALGTVLSFLMSVIALSLPEAIILRKVLKPRLIAAFFGIVAAGIILIGYLFNFIM